MYKIEQFHGNGVEHVTSLLQNLPWLLIDSQLSDVGRSQFQRGLSTCSDAP